MEGTRIKSLLIPLGGAVLLSGVAGAVYYFFNKKDEEEINLVKSAGQRCASTRVRVPVDTVGLVIGRQGANIKLIQDRTNTKIDFSDEEVDGHRTCCIRGSEENIGVAQQLILKAVNDQPVIETAEMLVPQVAVGRIIGRSGDVIRRMCHSTGAKITVEREEERPIPPTYPEDMRRIVLKGSREQIEAAKAQLLDKVGEEKAMRQQISASAANMSFRARSRQNNQETDANQLPVSSGSLEHESLSTGSSDRFLEAYISAVDSATHFWLQVVGPRSVQLDKMVTEMTEYYSSEENRDLHYLEKVKEGSMVAAKFPHDNSWYRGRVCDCQEEEKGRQVTVYYVDFGDKETVNGESVFELRTDFLRLSFQAVECFLANIAPESAGGDEAADTFEELTYAAQWRPVMVKVVGYRQEESGGTIPCVQIIDTNGPADVDVAEELVKRGLAEFANGMSSSTS